MARTIPQRELRNDNARIMAAVAGGEEFVITRNGQPVAELRPVADQRRIFVPSAELVAVALSGPGLDATSLRADLDAATDGRLVAGPGPVGAG